MEKQCSQLESDNQTLLHKLRDQEQQAGDDDGSSTRKMSGLQGELLTSEMEVYCYCSVEQCTNSLQTARSRTTLKLFCLCTSFFPCHIF